MLCHVVVFVLCCIVLCYVVLCCVVLYCAVLCCAMLCCSLLCFVRLCCSVGVVLYCVVLWFLYCVVLCCAMLCCSLLWFVLLCLLSCFVLFYCVVHWFLQFRMLFITYHHTLPYVGKYFYILLFFLNAVPFSQILQSLLLKNRLATF